MRAPMGVIGNLNEYVKYQMGPAWGRAATARRGSAQMAVGFGIAQEMMKA